MGPLLGRKALKFTALHSYRFTEAGPVECPADGNLQRAARSNA
jgi:hypothetical protein